MLLSVGDLIQHRVQIDATHTPDEKYDYSSCFVLVEEQTSHADIAIGNFEITLGRKPYRGCPIFNAPDEYLQTIKDVGFDVLFVANNHCLDRGRKGLKRTITQIDSLVISYTGTYRNVAERIQRHPLFIRKKGFCIAIFNYTHGTNGIRATPPSIVNYINKETILEDIHNTQAVCPNAIIACMYWREEYRSLPNREQRELADRLLEQGVTHIIGPHPRVIRPMGLHGESSRQCAAAHSLGNSVSNMSVVSTDGRLIFTLQLEKYPLPSPVHPLQGRLGYSPLPNSFIPSFLFSRVTQYRYTLVWTARPTLTEGEDYILYPSYSPIDQLPQAVCNRLNISTENSREFLLKYNTRVYENSK